MSKKYKVAYNGSYGGFRLSDEAVKWLEQNAREEVKEFLAAERVRVTESRKNNNFTKSISIRHLIHVIEKEY